MESCQYFSILMFLFRFLFWKIRGLLDLDVPKQAAKLRAYQAFIYFTNLSITSLFFIFWSPFSDEVFGKSLAVERVAIVTLPSQGRRIISTCQPPGECQTKSPAYVRRVGAKILPIQWWYFSLVNNSNNQSINQSINQSNNQSTNQSTNHSNKSIQFNSIQIKSIQSNPIQSNPIQFNSIQFNQSMLGSWLLEIY